MSTIKERFDKLVAKWKDEALFHSSVTAMTEHPAYQEICNMSPEEVLPLIRSELEKGPDHWFVALRILTGEDPVKYEDRGKVQKMADTWIKWLKETGH